MALDKAQYQQMKRASTAFWAGEMLRGPNRPPFNGRFMIGPPHMAWSKAMQRTRNIVTLAARGLGKSQWWSFAVPLWYADTFPGDSGLLFGSTEDKAFESLLKIEKEVEENPKLEHLQPKSGGRWSAEVAEFGNGFRIAAKGYGSRARGPHPRFITLDDVLGEEHSWSPTLRKRSVNYFYGTVFPGMAGKIGSTYLVGTPLAADDLLATVADNKKFTVLNFPILGDDGIPAWSLQYNASDIQELQASMPSLQFEREYLLRPIGDLSSLFPSQLFDAPGIKQSWYTLGQDWKWWAQRGIVDIYMGVDFGLEGQDATVIFVIAVDKDGCHWVVDIQVETGLSYYEQRARIVKAATKYNPCLIYVEANQAQTIYGQTLQTETDLPVKPFKMTKEKHSDSTGIPGTRMIFETKKVRIPYGDPRSIQVCDFWQKEMNQTTIHQGRVKTVGKHDDTVSAWYICQQAIRSFQFNFWVPGADRANYVPEIGQALPPVPSSGAQAILLGPTGVVIRARTDDPDGEEANRKADREAGGEAGGGGLFALPPGTQLQSALDVPAGVITFSPSTPLPPSRAPTAQEILTGIPQAGGFGGFANFGPTGWTPPS